MAERRYKRMITHTAKDGTETKYTNRQYRKFFAEKKGKEYKKKS